MTKFGLQLTSLLLSFAIAYGGSGFKALDYYKRFYGEGTYYGYTEGGNCAMGRKSQLPRMYQKMLAIAINDNQYDNSKSCGACIKLTGYGRGLGGRPIRGTFTAYVHDRCPECHRGDLDLSSSGDGRWKINWKFIPCPYNDASFVFEGSNNFYKKIQVRGLRYPAKAMWIAGRYASRSQDNFFIAGGWFPYYGFIRVIDIKGNTFKAWVNLNIANGVIPAPRKFNGFIKPPPKPKPKPKPTPSPTPRYCVPDWLPCIPGKVGKGCCNKNFKCKTVAWSIFKHCLS